MSGEERRRVLKRRRSIQRCLDEQILEEALTETKLEESVMDEEIVEREREIFGTRRRTIRLEMGIASAKKKIRLQTLGNRVESTLDRLNYAKDSLNTSVAKKIQLIEDEYSKDKAAHELELQRINREEERMQDSLRLRQRDRLIFLARDLNKTEEELVARIQANETDDQISEDEDQEDEDDGEEEDEVEDE